MERNRNKPLTSADRSEARSKYLCIVFSKKASVSPLDVYLRSYSSSVEGHHIHVCLMKGMNPVSGQTCLSHCFFHLTLGLDQEDTWRAVGAVDVEHPALLPSHGVKHRALVHRQ